FSHGSAHPGSISRSGADRRFAEGVFMYTKINGVYISLGDKKLNILAKYFVKIWSKIMIL
ncbi:MAG: hypothetical protein LBB56_07230, partial [Chitinispirillales bacterium]|nr:hypothetical protein [Chitinispirillales bacterium]